MLHLEAWGLCVVFFKVLDLFFGCVNNSRSLILCAWNHCAGNLHVRHGLRIPKDASVDVNQELVDGNGLYGRDTGMPSRS